MNENVDNRVVSMQFDNKKFESNVQTTLGTLEKLKQSLNMKGAAKGLENIDSTAKKINFAGLANAVETVNTRFSALQVMGVTALANITNSAVNAGKRMAKALTIDPIKTGFQEYETQINSVQTILANTESKGSTLQDVNNALAELNEYADKTIYNFTEMTRNIGTFTAAGVELDTSVAAIKGIANLAAVSGSTSQQASTAMYQLSQALSSGTVKLMDWNSVVNAGMGGQVFQDSLKETARVHNIAIDDMIKKNGSFRETLQEGWLTSEILLETLQKFTGDLNEEQLKAMGYTDEQIAGIVKMGQTANDAATKVKTFTQLFDTLKEAAQSGWTKSWEILVGDFGEAKELLTEISDIFGGMIGASADNRNELLSGALSTGWKQLLNEGITDAAGFEERVTEVAKKHGVDLSKMIDDETTFQDTLKSGWMTTEILSESVEAYGKKLKGMSKEQLEAAGYTMRDVEAFKELENNLTTGAITLEEFTALMVRPSGRELLIESFRNSLNAILAIVAPIKGAFTDIFGSLEGSQLYNIIEGFKNFTESLKLNSEQIGNIRSTFRGLFALIDIGVQAVKALFGGFIDVVKYILPAGNGLLSFTANVGEFIVGIDEAIKKGDIFKKAIEFIGKILKPVADGVKTLGKAISDAFKSIADTTERRFQPLTSLGNMLMAVFTGIGNVLKKVAPWIFSAVKGIGNVLKSLMDTITESFANADYSKVFDVANGGIFAAIGIYIAKFIKSGGDLVDKAGEFLDGTDGILGKFKDILGGVSDALNAFTESTKAKTLKNIAVAIGILAASLFVISLIDSEKLTASLAAVATLFGELMGTMSIFGRITDKHGFNGITKVAGAMIALSTALFILALALKIVSTMSWQEMGVGLISITVGLGVLVGAVNLLPDKKVETAAKAIKKMASALVVLAISIKILSTMSWSEMGVGLISMTVGLGALVGALHLLPKDVKTKTAGMIGLATSMVILASALKVMATLSWDDIFRSLTALTVSLGALVGAMVLMKFAKGGAGSVFVVASSMLVLSGVLKILSTMSWDDIVRSLTAMGVSLGLIVGAMVLMKFAQGGAGSILVVASSMLILAGALKVLGGMSWEEVIRGLAALAGTFVVFGLAGLVLGPLVGVIAALSKSVALFGLGVLAAGAGVLVFAAGLTALAAALGASGGAIAIFVSSIIALIPYLIQQIGVGIIALCEVIAGSAAAICKALAVIIVALVDAIIASVPALVEGIFVLIECLIIALVDHGPSIVGGVVDFIIGIINALAERLPDLIQAGVNFLMQLFVGIVDALKGIDVNTLIQGLIGVGLMAGLMMALSAVAALVPTAMIGVLGMGLVIAELALVLAAIGALAQIPGLEWLISEGGDFLQTVGTAIGKFLGGIIGGFAEGMSSALPQIGSDLSAFMINATPFLVGAKMIDSAALEGVKALADIILTLTAANILESLTSWFTGGSSLAKFGEEIAAFAPYIKSYADTVKGIDGTSVQASANAAKALGEMVSYLPKEGGVVGWFAGETDIPKFGGQLIAFGTALKAFSVVVAGLDVESINLSVTAAKGLSELAASIPNIGGVVSWFTGDNDLATFGLQIVAFGSALKAYSATVIGLDIEAIATSVTAAKALSKLSSSLDNIGGMVTWFTGDNDLGTFGKTISEFGGYLKKYSDKVTGIDADALSVSTTQLSKLIKMSKSASEVNFDGLGSFGTALTKLGESGIEGFIKSFKDSTEQVIKAGEEVLANLIKGMCSKTKDMTTSIAVMVKTAVDSLKAGYNDFKTAGSFLVDGFAAGISANTYKASAQARAMAAAAAEAAKEELDEHSPSKVGYEIGDFFGVAFVNAIGDYELKAYRAGSNVAKSAKEGLGNAISKIADIVSNGIDTQPTIRPVIDLSDVRSGASAIGSLFNGRRTLSIDTSTVGAISASMSSRQNGGNSDLLSAIKGLRKDFANAPRNTYSIGGITYDDGSNVAEAIKTLIRVTKVEKRT